MDGSFEDYWFSGKGNNNTCKNNPFKCEAPHACALQSDNRRRYCCDQGNVCWAGATNCNSDGSTRKCGEQGKTQWCCLEKDERCTLNAGQINVCWSTKPNVLNKIDIPDLKEVYSALSKKEPDASSYPFSPATLLAVSSTSSSSATTSTGGTAPAVVTTPTETSPVTEQPASGGLQAGAIAGIVIGAIAGILIGGLLTWWLLKKRRRSNATAAAIVDRPPVYQDDKNYYGGAPGAGAGMAGMAAVPHSTSPPVHAAEMPVDQPTELPASPAGHQQHDYHQPGAAAPYQVSTYTGSSQPSTYNGASTYHGGSPHTSPQYPTYQGR